eukprot:g2861.t1
MTSTPLFPSISRQKVSIDTNSVLIAAQRSSERQRTRYRLSSSRNHGRGRGRYRPRTNRARRTSSLSRSLPLSPDFTTRSSRPKSAQLAGQYAKYGIKYMKSGSPGSSNGRLPIHLHHQLNINDGKKAKPPSPYLSRMRGGSGSRNTTPQSKLRRRGSASRGVIGSRGSDSSVGKRRGDRDRNLGSREKIKKSSRGKGKRKGMGKPKTSIGNFDGVRLRPRTERVKRPLSMRRSNDQSWRRGRSAGNRQGVDNDPSGPRGSGIGALERSGWLTHHTVGHSGGEWRRVFYRLRGRSLRYFATDSPDAKAEAEIMATSDSQVRPSQLRHNCFELSDVFINRSGQLSGEKRSLWVTMHVQSENRYDYVRWVEALAALFRPGNKSQLQDSKNDGNNAKHDEKNNVIVNENKKEGFTPNKVDEKGVKSGQLKHEEKVATNHIKLEQQNRSAKNEKANVRKGEKSKIHQSVSENAKTRKGEKSKTNQSNFEKSKISMIATGSKVDLLKPVEVSLPVEMMEPLEVLEEEIISDSVKEVKALNKSIKDNFIGDDNNGDKFEVDDDVDEEVVNFGLSNVGMDIGMGMRMRMGLGTTGKARIRAVSSHVAPTISERRERINRNDTKRSEKQEFNGTNNENFGRNGSNDSSKNIYNAVRIGRGGQQVRAVPETLLRAIRDANENGPTMSDDKSADEVKEVSVSLPSVPNRGLRNSVHSKSNLNALPIMECLEKDTIAPLKSTQVLSTFDPSIKAEIEVSEEIELDRNSSTTLHLDSGTGTGSRSKTSGGMKKAKNHLDTRQDYGGRPLTNYRSLHSERRDQLYRLDSAPRKLKTTNTAKKDRIYFADEKETGFQPLVEHSPPYYGDALVVPASLVHGRHALGGGRLNRNGDTSCTEREIETPGYGPGGKIRFPCHRSGACTPPILKVVHCNTPSVEVCQGLLMQRVTLRQKRNGRNNRGKSKQQKSSWRRRWVSLHGSTLFIYEKESCWGLPPCDLIDLRPMVLELPRSSTSESGNSKSTEDAERRFKLTTAFACYQFQAPTAAARSAWVRTLRLVLKMQRQRISDGKQVSFIEAEFGHGPLGLHLAVRNGRIVVENCAPSSAAARRDIAVGDMIVAANGVPMEYSLTSFQTELQFLKTAPRPLRILLERVDDEE